MLRRSRHSRPDVLVVNSDPTIAGRLTSTLRGAGFRAIQAESFFEAKRVLSTDLPRLLIADVRLGDFNGLNLAWHRELTFPGPSIITDVVRDSVLEAEARKLHAPYLVLPEDHTVLTLVLQLLGAPSVSAPIVPLRWAHEEVGHSLN